MAAPPRDLRDDVALAVLPVLLAGTAGTVTDLRRRALVLEAFALSDEYLLQRAIALDLDSQEASANAPPASCVSGRLNHTWLNGQCRHCGTDERTFNLLSRRFRQRRHDGRLRRAG